MNQEFRPVDQSIVNLRQCFRVVLRQLDSFPEFGRRVCAFDSLHVEVEGTCVGVRADGGIATVGEGAGLAVTEAGDIVFVAAEVLFLCGL